MNSSKRKKRSFTLLKMTSNDSFVIFITQFIDIYSNFYEKKLTTISYNKAIRTIIKKYIFK